MRIVILVIGTRGDVQPSVALGKGFRRAGYDVRLVAPQRFESLVTDNGLEFAALPGDPVALIGGLVDKAGHDPIRTMRVMLDYALPIAVDVMRCAREACQDADAIFTSFFTTIFGHEIARERNVPDFSAQIFPTFTPTRYVPNPGLPQWRLGGVYNRLTHTLLIQAFWLANRYGFRRIRRRAPDVLPDIHWPFRPSDRPRTPTLYGFSRHVLAPPDWQDSIYVTGYWFLDTPADWQPPPELARFLAAGPPPVSIGFGSIVTTDIERLTRAVVDALAQAGQRGILLGGWAGLGQQELPGTMLRLDEAPHDWLFPRLAAVVHHGGAGTTGAALRAGMPNVIVPFTADQPFWGRRVQALGVGPAPIWQHRLTAERLASALRTALDDPAMRQRAAALGEKIRDEDGLSTAVRVFERVMHNWLAHHRRR
ncbi:MAG: glycosyltransferase family 1 protein [Chloroflexi bacterium]|nr:glycosyltransferase family 1 protein [Chloroflexota bacterium]